MPSLRQLQYLVYLGQTGHFRIAAEKAGVSQPTLSAQLQALEQRLGVQLVERSRTPVIFTDVGQRILRVAEHVVADVRDIIDTAQTQRQGLSGVVRLGLPTSIGPYLLPSFLPTFHAAYPDLRFHIRESIPAALPDALATGMSELVILPFPVRGGDFEAQRLFREPLFLAIPADHDLAVHDTIEAGALAGQPILALEGGHALHEQVQALCDEFGARLLHDYEGTSLSTLQQMVATGLGFTFLPGLFVRAGEHRGIKLLTLRSKPLHRTIGLMWRKSSPLAKTYGVIADHLRATVRQKHPDFLVFES